jgi:hypothetical protein
MTTLHRIAVISGSAETFFDHYGASATSLSRARNMVRGEGWEAFRITSQEAARGRDFDEILLLPGWIRQRDIFDTLRILSWRHR